ncbi:hypothetical protein ACFXJ5_10900 [Streptomyces sp. NPDC059373]
MHTRTTAAPLFAGAALLAACSSSSDTTPSAPTNAPAAPVKAYPPGPAGCHDALKDQYEPGTVTLAGAPTDPPACQGRTSDEVSQIAEDVINEQIHN